MQQKAFTLIELLVVVLIIGILAAVAVPQYQKAVWKSRFVQAKLLVKNLVAAEEVYYMENGSYTTDYSHLSIEVPAERFYKQYAYFPWGYCELYDNAVACRISMANSASLDYMLYCNQSSHKPGVAVCLAKGGTAYPTVNDINYQICKGETKKAPISWGANAYGWEY